MTGRALLSFGDDLIVGGTFNCAGGVAAANISQWDGTSWHAIGDGLPFSVFSIIQYGHDIVAGGSSVMRWDGSSWKSVGDSSPSVGPLNNMLILCGRITVPSVASVSQ